MFLSNQSGAVEACWAHSPEVRGSKPRSAITFKIIYFLCFSSLFILLYSVNYTFFMMYQLEGVYELLINIFKITPAKSKHLSPYESLFYH